MTRRSSGERRRHPALVVAVAAIPVLALLSACGANSSASNTADGGTLTIGTATDITDTDSIQVRDSDDDLLLGSTVYEPLFNSGPNNQLTPGLAKSATSSHDFKTWTLQLQQGVKFQDGNPFNAASVKANMDATLNPKNGSDNAGDFAMVAKTVVVSKYVVQFDLKYPDNGFPALLTDNFMIGDMTLRAKEGAKAFAEHPVGTGPYEFVSRIVGNETVFKRFNGYWRGRPPLAEVIVKVVTDPTIAALDLEHGDLDLVDNFVSNPALPILKKDGLQLIHRPGITFSLAFLNEEKARRGGYKNALAFREGLTGLFDAPKVVPEVIGAYGKYADQQIASFVGGSNPNIKPPVYDPKKDIKLLTEGGYPPGSTISIVVNTAPELCDVATVVQSNIEKLGYHVNLLCNGGNLENNAVLAYKWDALLTKLNESPVTPTVYYMKRWEYYLAVPHDDYYTLEDPALQKLLMSTIAQPTVAKTNVDIQKMENIIENQQHAIIPLFWADSWLIANKCVHGLVPTPNSWNDILWNSYTKVTMNC